MNKIRKIELICYGYGTRTIYELDSIDLAIDRNNKDFNLRGKILKIKHIGKKYLKKLKNG